ncbi:MAG: N-acetylneuraminate synthase family protein [Hyphomicrobiales bacterium]|nr:N-acetylneuraminate synthase family protein [Hyphomicrobiales bacterium]
MREMNVAGVRIANDTDVFVIAEIGHNHQGDMEKCKQLFDAAKESGANAVKLQKRQNKTMFTKAMYNEVYNSENAYAETYGEHREFLEFDFDQYKELKEYAEEIGIVFFSTAFDIPSADFLAKLDIPCFKMASGDLTNLPLLKYVAEMGKPMFMSTGGGTMDDVRRAHDAVAAINSNFCIMQCTAGYPPEWEELNLAVIATYRDAFPDTVIGFSSHDSGIAMALAAYPLGMRVVEKHFTLNRAWKGTDQAFSLEKPGLRRLVRDLRRVRIAMGDGVKRQYDSEKKPLYKMAKKLVFNRDLPQGHVLTSEDIACKVPNDGIPPYRMDEFVGKTLTAPVIEDQSVAEELVR